MKHCFLKRTGTVLLAAFLYMSLSLFPSIEALAAPVASEDGYAQQAEERKLLPVQSNEIANWPGGPSVSAQSAILLEANTGAILYAKNIHEKLYPASTTKLMTCLIAAENASMNETVSFSHDAVFSLEPGSSNIGIDPGQAMPMEECLYGILVASANEVANAVAEHVAGSMDAFVDMMNQKAEELGCENTHFMNSHGLYHDEHYTSAYDLALIAKAFFQNELLSKIGNTASHHFVATAKQPDDFITRNKHKLITGEIPYEGVKGGKTGYTDEARQTLVTCAEKNGMKLICVVMKEEAPEQFYDTVKLFDYGFTNFTAANISENETDYTLENTNLFHDSYDVFGSSAPALFLNRNSFLILPKTVDFSELDSEISYETAGETEAARINYSYHGVYLGSAAIEIDPAVLASYGSDNESPAPESSLAPDTSETPESPEPSIIFINVKIVACVVLGLAALAVVLSFVHDILTNYNLFNKGRSRRWRRRRKGWKNGPHL